MTYKKMLITVVTSTALLLAGCATTGSGAPPATQSQRLAAMAPWVAKGNLVAVEVPAPSNPLSSQLLLATLKAGSSSNTIDQIVDMVRGGSATTLAVMGNNTAINAATVQAALKKLSGSNSRTTLLLVGEPEDSAALQAAATAAGVRLEITPIR